MYFSTQHLLTYALFDIAQTFEFVLNTVIRHCRARHFENVNQTRLFLGRNKIFIVATFAKEEFFLCKGTISSLAKEYLEIGNFKRFSRPPLQMYPYHVKTEKTNKQTSNSWTTLLCTCAVTISFFPKACANWILCWQMIASDAGECDKYVKSAFYIHKNKNNIPTNNPWIVC